VPRVSVLVIALTLYSRPGCHLCDEMKAIVEQVARTVPLTLAVIDISTDAALDAEYRFEIPVLLVNGRKAAKYRIGAEELRKMLLSRHG
jgi:hypothetical protein